jgi:hypothetical protein
MLHGLAEVLTIMQIKLFNILILLVLTLLGTASLANDQTKSTVELYNDLLPREQSALCAVSSLMVTPKDEAMSQVYLKDFRIKANVLPLISDDMLIKMGKKWIVDNGYTDRIPEVYQICKG